MAQRKCPHCNKRISNEVMEICQRYVEDYGDKGYVLVCSKCKKKMYLCFEQIIKLVEVEKASDDENVSWSHIKA